MPSTNVFNELCFKITAKIYSEKNNLTGVCNPVYFRLCIDMMHITPPVTAEEFDGSHHPRYAVISLNFLINGSLIYLTFRYFFMSFHVFLVWSHWFEGDCSASCGNGTRERLRHCSTGRDVDCIGKAFELVPCIQSRCI